ncbi:hypothetical protein, partial [Methylobacterium trifolii]|uniref:hypothetical protein n=1 Tax=Methylobacterium trifolii TaxID=1003092 RepID=UPI0035A22E59
MAQLTVGTGPGFNYATIQAAINASNNGDTITIAAGNYNETVDLNKSVTLIGPQASPNNGNAQANVTGGIYVTANGATINGLEISGVDPRNPLGNDYPTALEVTANNVSVSNTLLQGVGINGAESRPLTLSGTATGFAFTNNTVRDWSEGAYFVRGSSGTVSGNKFDNNGNHIVTESDNFVISGNAFGEAIGSSVAFATFGTNVNFGTILPAGNTFTDDAARPVSIFPNNSSARFVGTSYNETFNGDALAGPFDYNAGGGSDRIFVSLGADTIDGGMGADSIEGPTARLNGDLLNLSDLQDTIVVEDATAGLRATINNSNQLLIDADGNGSIDATLIISGQSNIQAVVNAGTQSISFRSILPPPPPPGPTVDDPITQTGTEGPDSVSGAGGNDTLYGAGGDDTIMGLGGDDFIQGNQGRDNLFGNQGN